MELYILEAILGDELSWAVDLLLNKALTEGARGLTGILGLVKLIFEGEF